MSGKPPSEVYELTITLRGSSPAVWRRVLVSSDATLEHLHDVIQRAFGWDDKHLHLFAIRGVEYGASYPDDPDSTLRNEKLFRLADVLNPEAKFFYEYDFGDSWEHDVRVERVLEDAGAEVPRCVDGAGSTPPEDSGGVERFAEMLEALADPKHPSHQDARDWLGDDFVPTPFDLAAANRALGALRPRAKRATKPKA